MQSRRKRQIGKSLEFGDRVQMNFVVPLSSLSEKNPDIVEMMIVYFNVTL